MCSLSSPFFAKEGVHLIGVLLVSHGATAQAMRAASIEILGSQEALFDYAVTSDYAVCAHGERLREILNELCRERMPVVISDFKLGTPFNLLVSLSREFSFHHLTGMNMPMLLYVLEHRTDPGITGERLCTGAIAKACEETFDVNVFIESLEG